VFTVRWRAAAKKVISASGLFERELVVFMSISTQNVIHFDRGRRFLNFCLSSSSYGFVIVSITHALEPWLWGLAVKMSAASLLHSESAMCVLS